MACGLLCILAGCSKSPEEKSAAWVQSATAALGRKEYNRAVIELQNAMQATPQDAEAHFQMGRALQFLGDPQKAYRYFKRAVALKADHAGALLGLATILNASGDSRGFPAAEEYARKGLQRNPNDPDTLHALAEAESRQGKTQLAIEHLKEALKTDPSHLKSSATLAYIQWSVEHDATAAENTLREAVQRHRNSAESLVALGRFYALIGRPDAAEAQFRQATVADPQYGPALVEMARLQMSRGRPAEAKQTLARLSALPDKSYRTLHALFLFRNGEKEAAIAELKQLRGKDPSDAEVRTRLVELYLQSNRFAEAEKELAGALSQRPSDTGALEQQVQLYVLLRRYQEAEKSSSEALRLGADTAPVHYLRAQACRGLGRPLDERQELQLALELNPSLLPARIDLARSYRSSKAAGDALAVIDEAPEQQKQEPALIEERIWVLFAQGNYAAAKPEVTRALAKSRQPSILTQAGLLALQEKRNEAGRSLLEESLRSAPDDTDTLNAIALSYVSEGKRAAAVERVRKQAALSPRAAPLQFLLGSWLEKSGDLPGARAAYTASLDADASLASAIIACARMDMLDGRWETARKRLEQLLAKEPQNVSALLAKAMVEEGSGRIEAAIQDYRLILRLDPAHLVAKNNLVVRLSENPATADEAIIFALELKRAAPDDAEVDDTVGWAHYQKGSYDRAIKYLSSAASRSKSARIRYHLAMAYFRAGSRSLGEKTLAAALVLNPSLPEAEHARRIASSAP